MENAGNQFKDVKLINSISSSGLGVTSFAGQRSRHHNSVKYSTSANVSSRVKSKTGKGSKSKKKTNSYHKIPECKNSKNSHQRSPNMHYEFSNKPSISSKVAGLNNMRYQNPSNEPIKRNNSSEHTKGSDSFNQLKQHSASRERAQVKIHNFGYLNLCRSIMSNRE